MTLWVIAKRLWCLVMHRRHHVPQIWCPHQVQCSGCITWVQCEKCEPLYPTARLIRGGW